MNQSAESKPIALPFAGDTTLRWACRHGEYVMWVAARSMFTADRASGWTIRDFWQMRDGDHLTITNRWADLPSWFELHPTEVAGSAYYEMGKRLNAGYDPKSVIDGPNLWRVKAGDRLVWVSVTNPAQPVKELINFRECGLVLGENVTPSLEGVAAFGAPKGETLPSATITAMRSGLDATVALGVPRELAMEWKFGA